ncbi:8160_t:CDS:2 [Funneliformis geosporum]|nr:8160_t:CDS:2 [Funneliformis geosporum]
MGSPRLKYTTWTYKAKVEFSRNNKAYWEEGHLLRWDVKSNKWFRHGEQWVKLVTNYSAEKHLGPRVLKLESEFSISNSPSMRLIYGVTRNPITKEYAVIENLMDQCPSCGQKWMSPRWCRGCNSELFKSERSNWTSGNSEIDDFIYEAQTTAEFPEQVLEWLPETQFTEFKLIGKGGFGRVFKAYWEKGRICKWDFITNKWERSDPMWVALKSVEKGGECISEFLEEVKAMYQCLKINLGSLDCYGITRNPATQDYLIVMRFVEYGDLRAYLSSTFATSSWKDRLDRLWSLSIDLRSLHRSGLVHRDLHGGNVLFGNNRRSFIADLGLTCKDGQTETGDIKGVLPYVAPEILHRKPHTKSSDIYSFSIIMWEFTSSRPPFFEMMYDYVLAHKICGGLRPPIIKGTPECYAQLMKQCWDADPTKRPTAQILTEALEKWAIILSKEKSNDDDDDEVNIRNQFKLAELERQKNPFPVVPFSEINTRPLTSRLLPTINLHTITEGYQTIQYDLEISDDL